MCPDCNRACPFRGTLSDDCSVCHCTNTIAFGTVRDENNMPLGDVGVYIQSRQWEPLTTTNAYGQYVTQGVCLMGENLVFKKDRYQESTGLARLRNLTHWICDTTLKQTVPPTFYVSPKDKVRMVGQGVVLCCKADGRPGPEKYIWIKDGKEIKGGANGKLHMGNLNISHSGHYSCRVETYAGIATSKEAILSVKKQAQDTCNQKPDEYFIDLPDGCHTEELGGKKTRVDIGRCRKSQCITSTMSNEVDCYDAWPKFCCSTDLTKPLMVNCTRFTYTITQTIACKCRECSTVTQISGEAYGKRHGTKIPFKSGQLYLMGRLAGETNDNGFFSITVPGDEKEVVLLLKNDADNQFMSTLKTVKIIEDVNTYAEIVVPLKSKPILFNSNIGHTMALSNGNQTAFSHVSFPRDSFVTQDGKPFSGIVHASFNFMDPRNIDDIESAYGSLSTLGEDGREIPLDTYGMTSFTFNDDNGNSLTLNSPVTYSIDASQFNISIDEDGKSEIYEWYLDIKTGKWVKIAQFKTKNQLTNKRRLLSTTTLQVDVPPQPNIKIKREVTKLNRTTSVVSRTEYFIYYDKMYNFDRLGKRTGSRTVNTTRVKYVIDRKEEERDDACVVSVKVYQDTTFQLPLGAGISVTAVTYNPLSSKYSGRDVQTTNEKGIACLTIFCNQNVTLYAKQSGTLTNLVTSNNHSLPGYYARTNINNNTGVMFEAIESSYDPKANKYSPVRLLKEKPICLSPRRDDYHFQFAPLVKSEDFSPVFKEETRNILSWYTDAKDKQERRSCFLKVRVTAPSDVQARLRIIAKSYQNVTGPDYNESKYYGMDNVGPIPDMSVTPVNFSERAACLEFRCAGAAFDDKILLQNLTTYVDITTTNSDCTFSPRNEIMEAFDLEKYDVTGRRASFFFRAEKNYGPVYGVYIQNGHRDNARNWCHAGGLNANNVMNTDESRTLGTFSCK
nr:cartilage intermediate layer protein 1-like isoform X2 [Crassostrea virginica]